MSFRIFSREIKVNIPHGTGFLECLLLRIVEQESQKEMSYVVPFLLMFHYRKKKSDR